MEETGITQRTIGLVSQIMFHKNRPPRELNTSYIDFGNMAAKEVHMLMAALTWNAANINDGDNFNLYDKIRFKNETGEVSGGT